MKQALQTEAPSKRELCYGRLFSGVALLGMAGGAMTVDLMNNVIYGWQKSPMIGAVMGLGAIGLTVIPMAAARDGWNLAMRAGTLVCAIVTIFAAASAYTEELGADIDHKQGASLAYETARANAAAARLDLDAAKTEAAAIAEMASVADLQEIVRVARDLAQTEAKDRGGRGKLAKAHEDKVQATLDRIPDARRREAALARAEKAQVRIDAAQSEAKSGPVEVSALGTAVAGYIGGTPEAAARQIAITMSVLVIVLTVILALLAENATKLIIAGWKGEERPEPVQVPAPALPKAAAPPSLTERVAQFAEATFKTGCRISGSELYIRFESWWIANFRGERMPTPAELSKLLVEKGIQRKKLGGRMQYWLDENAKAAA